MLWNAAVKLLALQIAAAPVVGAAGLPAAAIHDPLPVNLVVSDRFGFREDFLAAISNDVLEILRSVGIEATWSPEEPVNAEAGSHRWKLNDAASFLVVFSGKSPSAWGG